MSGLLWTTLVVYLLLRGSLGLYRVIPWRIRRG